MVWVFAADHVPTTPTDSIQRETKLPSDDFDKLFVELAAVRRRVGWLTTALFLVALTLLFTVAAVLGAVIDFHYGEGVLIAGTAGGGAAMGFLFGWLACRAR